MAQPQHVAAATDLDTLPDLLAPVLAKYRIVVALAVLGLIAMTGLSFLIQPRYTVAATIAPANHEERGSLNSSGALSQLTGLVGLGNPISGDFVRDSLGILNSEALVAKFIEHSGFIAEYCEVTGCSATGPDSPTMPEAIDHFSDNVLRISQDNFTGLLTVSIEWHDAELAKSWVASFIRLANEQIRQRQIDYSQRGNEYLAKELEKHTSLELRQSIYRLMESNLNMGMLANTREEFAFTVLDPPAVPAEGDYSWPNRILFAAFGLAAGGGMAVFFVLLMHFRRARSK